MQVALFDHCGDVVGPQLGIGILARVQWLVGHAVAAEVQRDQAELFRQVALHLVTPAQVVGRPTVDQEHRWAVCRPHSRTCRACPAPPVTVCTMVSVAAVRSAVVVARPSLLAARGVPATCDQERAAACDDLSATFPRFYRGWMRFTLLGPIEVHDDGNVLEISGMLPRRLLAILLVQARTVVSVDRLVDSPWGEPPPRDPRLGLWMCVARLRRALAAGESGPRSEWVITRAPGYLLSAEPHQIDADRFERLAAEALPIASDRPRAAADMLDQALGLWRGPALQEFADEPFAAAEAARLDELLPAIKYRWANPGITCRFRPGSLG